MDWLTNLDYGHWWLLAGLMLLLELAAPTYFFLWLGIAAAAIGFVVIVFPSIPLGVQLTVFALLVIVAGLSWHHARRVQPGDPESSAAPGDQPNRTNR